MNHLAHTHDRCLTLREIVVPVPGRALDAPEASRRFLVYALHDAGYRTPVSSAPAGSGVLAVLEPFVLRLSREVGEQVLGGLMRIRTRVQGRPSAAGRPVVTPYHRTPSCPRQSKGG